MSLAGVQRPKLFAVMASAIMSISPIPLRIQYSVARWVGNTNTHQDPNPTPTCQVRLGAAAVFVGWLLRRGKRAKGTCWHNAFTNNCLLLWVLQGEHFMEMAVYEGQRCEKATGKISFLDSPPHNVLPASYLVCLWRVPLRAPVTLCVCVCLR